VSGLRLGPIAAILGACAAAVLGHTYARATLPPPPVSVREAFSGAVPPIEMVENPLIQIVELTRKHAPADHQGFVDYVMWFVHDNSVEEINEWHGWNWDKADIVFSGMLNAYRGKVAEALPVLRAALICHAADSCRVRHRQPPGRDIPTMQARCSGIRWLKS
jgi:hypothetical protein